MLKPFWELLKISSRNFSKNYLALTAILFIYLIPTVITACCVIAINPFGTGPITRTALYTVLFVYFLIAIAIMLYSFLIGIALLIYIGRTNRGEQVTLWGALREAFKQFKPSLILYALHTKKVMGGIIKFIIPGFYRAIIYAFAPFVFLLDKRTDIESLELSKDLIKPNIVKYLDYMLFAFVVAVLCCVPFIVVLDFAIDWSVYANHWRWVVVFNFLEVYVIFQVVLFVVVFNMVLFESLKEGQISNSAV